MGDKEGKVKNERKGSKNKKKIATIIIIIILIQVSSIAIWYVYFRPWSIRDVADACNVDFGGDDGDAHFFMNLDEESPSFSRELAGNSKMVKGRITGIITYMTTLGSLTRYELDNFEYIHLIEWASPRHDVGDEIEKRVHFEWSRWNEDENVYSPQLDFPGLMIAPGIGRIIGSVSTSEGIILMANQAESAGLANISVFLPKGEGFPLELFNCSLRQGVSSWIVDYMEASAGYRRNPIIDRMESLLNESSENNQIIFTDANHNGILDDWDFFTFNLTEPKEDSAILTYMFSINEGAASIGTSVLSGFCYIVATNRGVLRFISSSGEDFGFSPYYTLEVFSEDQTNEGINTIINVRNIFGEAMDLFDISLNVYSDGRVQMTPLHQGHLIGIIDRRIECLDNNNNEILDVGDQFILYDLQNLGGYEIRLSGSPNGEVLSYIYWRTGIGVYSGFLPIMEFINHTHDNSSHEIIIERMYGIPGLFLTQNDTDWRYMIHLERNDNEVLSPINLTLNFNATMEGGNITFTDLDENSFINSGDSFLFEGGPGSCRLTLDYVEQDNDEEEGFRLLHSQSFSFTI